MEWNNLDLNKVKSIETSCATCGKINIKVRGEELNCDFCGINLFETIIEDNQPITKKGKEENRVSDKVKLLEKELYEELNKWFPQGEDKEKKLLRARAYSLIRRAIELGVQGHSDNLKIKARRGGIKIIDVKSVGLCSKCREEGDEILKYKDGTIVPDKDIACISDAFGSCKGNKKNMGGNN